MTSYAVDTLRRRALIAHLSIKKYSARKTDRRASKRVEQENQAKNNMAVVKKTLLVHEKLREFQKVETAARQLHYRMTFPWTDTGLRLLPVSAHEDYVGQMGLLQDEAISLADDIAREYPSMKEEAKNLLGTLYDDSDYPPADKIRDYFNFDVVVSPMPHFSDDVRLNLTDNQAQMIKQETEARMEKALEESMQEAWNRLYKAVTHIYERMAPEKSFHYTTLDSTKELADLLPKLNITQDPKLDELAAELKARLSIYGSAKELREDETERKRVADGMNDILKNMDAFTPNKAA